MEKRNIPVQGILYPAPIIPAQKGNYFLKNCVGEDTGLQSIFVCKESDQ